MVSKDELRTIRDQAGKGLKADAIILPKHELDRIKAATVIQSKDEII